MEHAEQQPEQPVRRPRGRPRKRRRKEEEENENEAKRQAMGTRAVAFVGRYVLKEFPRNGVFLGKVMYYECGLYRVSYEDGDCEDLDSGEVRAILLNDGDFDDDLARRKGVLEKLVLKKNGKVENVSAEGSKEGLAVGVSELSEGLVVENDDGDGNDDDDDDDDGDSSSDSGLEGRHSGIDAEALPPLPPPLELPPSSGTIGVPEQCVSLLFAVYAFLRSFSIRLFLMPFTLDEFVGSLNCRIANSLFDAIHVSLMRVLRRHLETVSSEGSELASKCLRCYDWSMLDSLTWPVYLIMYLVVNGYKDGPEWKEFYDEVSNGEYYVLPVYRKLQILQILCDDVLASEEVIAEMNKRKESEVPDNDGEDVLPSEVGLRRVQPRYANTSACEDKEATKFVSASNAVNQPGNSISYLRDTESTEDCDVDRNGDECRLCGLDGTLLCCDGCPSAYHSRCIGVIKMHIPEGPWYCPECKINMTEPTIAKGTSLRGAEIFGRDLYGQLFMGTCEHLLVLNIDCDEFHLRYYNQNDIPKVLQVLYESMQHRPIYHDICMAVLQYWSVPENFLFHSVATGTNVNSSNIKEETEPSTSLLPSLGEGNNKPVSLVKEEYPLTTVSTIYSADMVPQCYANDSSNECPTLTMKLPEDTRIESIISADSASVSVSHQSDMNHQNFVDRPTVVDPAKCSMANGEFSNYGHANDTGLPITVSLLTKESTQSGFEKCERNVINDFAYKGLSYKPLSYINYYIHGDFAASAAAKFALLLSEESRSDGHVSDRRTASVNTYLQAKAFSLTASRFFWPSSEKKHVEVPRERCGWCFSCKAPVTSKRGCMLNHAALSGTKSAIKILAGFSPIRSGEGILPSIATYIIYMEECLRGLVVGPFLSASYRRQWRKRVEQATTFSAIKPLLLQLEENIRTIAFCGDWVKLMDDWLVEFPMAQSATSTVGTVQKRAPSGRRYKKRSAIDEASTDGCSKNWVWWRGGKFTKFIFQKAVLPKSMVRKAARQGGSRKISGISYADGFEIPKRSRQLVWRVAVQMSRNASQLALQVRYLDFYLRWSDLIRPEQNIQDGKGQETEASAFRNANICDSKVVEGRSCYGIAFGSQKHLPSRVMKNVVEIEQGPEGKEKYWFHEMRIPLYLVKEYEEGNGNAPCNEEHLNTASELLHRRRLKAVCKDIFFYLTCKRDNLDVVSCSVCQMGVLNRNAHKCNACQGYCHEGCSTSSTFSSNEVETICKQCYHARILAQKETNNESPNSPLLLQGRVNNSGAFLKGSRPKSHDRVPKSSRTKAPNPDMKQVTPVVVLKGTKAKCYEQEPTSTRTKDNQRPRKICSWGIIWKKKNNEDTGNDFSRRNILLKGGSSMPQSQPVCHLCSKPYSSDLMYICCEACQHWYHAEAVELEESKISSVLGFKCCKCRRIKSPTCPYADPKPERQEGKKSRKRPSKKEHSGAVGTDSGAIFDTRECEAATPGFPVEDGSTPVFPLEDDPLLFSLSSVELVTEPKIEGDVEWNGVPWPGLQKLPVRRKHEGDGDVSFGGTPLHGEFSTYGEAGNPTIPAEEPSEYASAVNDSDNVNVNYDYMDFEPHTYFSVTELLHSDDGNQFDGVDVSEDLSGYLENSSALAPGDHAEPAFSLQDTGYSCCKCLQMEPVPDRCCENCGMLIHSQCSPWPELPSMVENWTWRCGNCREW
ncbi:LOW QUALITY PROTEIN: DDT domain-containing protein PTM-like [Cajanus cajan]|uniref:LOW QUALITY PROTEIN: DDT domain-containing protein PTM-like n=1 Tax=Cajanus cajan TaxID=3821 RepID=UPI0010FB1EE7|nr:LOW QUALITY PROTEIN: DDT domain-containing protein PTM-like [Cajanus cajan]